MPRKVLVLLAVVALVAGACSRAPKGPQRYTVGVDAKSNAKEKFQFSAFFPADLTVSPGDSIKFRNRSTEAPHTVTFGVNADRSNQPPVVTQTGENPVTLGKCQSDKAPTTKMISCPSKRLGTFDGAGYWNSGYLQPKQAPRSAGPKNVTVKFDKDITPGNYAFVCVLHPLMNGNVTIVEDEGDRTKPADVRTQAKESAADARKTAEAFEEPKLETGDGTAVIAAGWGDRITAVNRFGPAVAEVDEGTEVSWGFPNPYEPHTITFESTFEGLPPEAFRPGGVKSGSDYTGGFANSGVIGPKGSPFEGEFSLKFTKPGTYEYACVLHPGMDGTVKVT